MPRAGTVQIDGKALGRLREERRITQRALAEKVGVSEKGVQRIEARPRVGVKYDTFNAIAEWLGKTQDQALALLKPAEVVSGVPMISINAEVPMLGLVSATGMRERPNAVPALVRFDGKKHFFLQVHGRCMEPRYEDGDLVLFDREEVARNGFVVGGEYAISMSGDEGGATFKRVRSVRSEALVLECLNPEFADRLTVRLADVVRAGRAVRVLKEVPIERAR